jgi:hypothetical protein
MRAGPRGIAAVAIAAGVVAATAAAAVSPAKLFSSMLAAGKAQRSVHYVSLVVSPTASVRIVGDAGVDRGRQQITYTKGGRSGHVTVLVVASTAYLRGDAFTLTNFLGFTAAAAASRAGQWLSYSPGDRGYTTVAAGVRLASAMNELRLPAPVTTVPKKLLHGRPVLGLRSSRTVSGQTVVDTVYVRAEGRPLPVAEVARQGQAHFTLTFSRWNEAVHVSAPSGATPIA